MEGSCHVLLSLNGVPFFGTWDNALRLVDLKGNQRLIIHVEGPPIEGDDSGGRL